MTLIVQASPESLTQNEINKTNRLSSPRRKRRSRLTSPSDRRVVAARRPAACRLPLGSRARGRDDGRLTCRTTSIHLRPASQEIAPPDPVPLAQRRAALIL